MRPSVTVRKILSHSKWPTTTQILGENNNVRITTTLYIRSKIVKKRKGILIDFPMAHWYL